MQIKNENANANGEQYVCKGLMVSTSFTKVGHGAPKRTNLISSIKHLTTSMRKLSHFNVILACPPCDN